MKHVSRYAIVTFFASLLIGLFAPLKAQTLVNGSFETGTFNGWSLAGTPAIVGAPPTVPDGNFQALINSTGTTGAGIYAIGNAVDPATLNAFTGTILPANGAGAVFNGEAIKQTLLLTRPGTLTFSYLYASRELGGVNGEDETGYVLNGVFHLLANAGTPGQSPTNIGFFETALPYQTLTINLPTGTNEISFVAYNTLNSNSPSGLYLDGFTLALNPGGTTFASTPGLTPNEVSTARYIDAHSGSTGGNIPQIILDLATAGTPQGIAAILDQLSPQSLQILRHVGIDNATFTTEDVNDHLANLRDGLTGFDGSGMTVNDPSQSPSASRLQRRLADPKAMRDPKEMSDTKEMTPAVSGTHANRWSAWIAGDVILANAEHDQDVAHQDYTTSSVMLGADYRLDEHFTVGALLGYSHTDADLDHNDSKATVDSYFPGIYASYVDGGWYANGLAAYNYNSYTENRNIDLPGISGSNQGAPQGNEYVGNLTGGYEFHTGAFKYGPFAGLQFAHVDIGSFDESGPTALHIDGQNVDSLRSQLGAEARFATRVGSVSLVPHISAAWQHEYLYDSHGISGSFQGVGDSFTVTPTHVGRDSAFIDSGLDATVCRDVTIFADYETEAGQSDFFAQSVMAGVRVGF